MDFMDSILFQWVLLPLLIFASRILDVTIGTIRIIFLSKGLKRLAPVFGFFEILIWLVAIRQLMSGVTNVAAFIAYAMGFAAGTFIGMFVEEKLSIGQVIIRIITRASGTKLASRLRLMGYKITELPARGERGEVSIIFTVINRKDLSPVEEIINNFNPNAFYSIEDVRFVKEGPLAKESYLRNFLFRRGRKGK
jgi:uncharacterized protein YebE (UPF0316 family)